MSSVPEAGKSTMDPQFISKEWKRSMSVKQKVVGEDVREGWMRSSEWELIVRRLG